MISAMSQSADSQTIRTTDASTHPKVDSLSIVVPVYNSQNSLPLLSERLAKVLPEVAERFELVLVNDASGDDSWDVICKLADTHDWIRGLDLMRNYGQQNASVCGIRAARGSVVITMDDDLQHPPDQIAKLLGPIHEGYDVVYGTPEQEQHGILRDLASQVTKLVLQGGMGAEIAKNISSFRALRTQLRDAFSGPMGPSVSVDVLLTWATSRFAAVRVQHDARAIDGSNYTLRKLIVHALNLTTGFSTIPLLLTARELF